MTFEKLSPKQKQIFRWCYNSEYEALICDGAVRSGKTVCMITSFILWSMQCFNGATFGICGKTVQSAERNIIAPLRGIVDITAYFKIKYNRNISLLTVEGNGRTNFYYVYGGKDESSYTLIQGITLSGVLFDEVALMPKSFVNQAISRTLSVSDAKLWFNCNPESQFHWFYKDWICKVKERKALHLHFLMSDNPSLTKEQLEHAENMFKGVFRDRYILGLWVSAEGVIYRSFAEDTEKYLIDAPPKDLTYFTVGFDFGGNGSAHAGICTGFSSRLQSVVILDEYYRKEVITPTELENDFIDFVCRCHDSYRAYDGYLDSAETTLIRGIKTACAKAKLNFNVHNARKGEIIDRIRFTNMLMSQGRFYVMRHCKHVIQALQTAVWDSKSLTDVRLDDGNYNIDSLDAFEYSVEPLMNDIIEAGVRI